jgi:hypothetical protein
MPNATTLLPFQPLAMSPAQLAAVSYPARYSGRTHSLYAFQLRRWFAWCDAATSTVMASTSSPPTSPARSRSGQPPACVNSAQKDAVRYALRYPGSAEISADPPRPA